MGELIYSYGTDHFAVTEKTKKETPTIQETAESGTTDHGEKAAEETVEEIYSLGEGGNKYVAGINQEPASKVEES